MKELTYIYIQMFMHTCVLITLQRHQMQWATLQRYVHVLERVCQSEPDGKWQPVYNLLAVKQGQDWRQGYSEKHLTVFAAGFRLILSTMRLGHQRLLIMTFQNGCNCSSSKKRWCSWSRNNRFSFLCLMRKLNSSLVIPDWSKCLWCRFDGAALQKVLLVLRTELVSGRE